MTTNHSECKTAFRDQKSIPLGFHLRSQCQRLMQRLKFKKKKDGKLQRTYWRPPDGSRQMWEIHHEWFWQILLPNWTSHSLLWRHFSIDPDISGSSHSVPKFSISDKCRITSFLFLWLQTIYDINGGTHCIHYWEECGGGVLKKSLISGLCSTLRYTSGSWEAETYIRILGLRGGTGQRRNSQSISQMILTVLAVLRVSEKRKEDPGYRTVPWQAPQCQTLEVAPEWSDQEPGVSGSQGLRCLGRRIPKVCRLSALCLLTR